MCGTPIAMAIVDIMQLRDALPPRTPLVGLDPGEKTLGVAVSDISLTIASPLALIRRTRFTK